MLLIFAVKASIDWVWISMLVVFSVWFKLIVVKH